MVVSNCVKRWLGYVSGLGGFGTIIVACLVYGILPSFGQSKCSSASACETDLSTLLQFEEAIENKEFSPLPNTGVAISVDGDVVVGTPVLEDAIRRNDIKLENVDIQIKFDGLDVTRRLNVSTEDARRTYEPGAIVHFSGNWNYPAWVERAEIRIYRHIDKYSAEAVAHPVEIVQMPVFGENAKKAEWQSYTRAEILGEEGGNLVYALRVYDQAGRYDETIPLGLNLSEAAEISEEREIVIAPGEGDDRTLVSNIPLYGGSITVHGRNVPYGYHVEVLGETIAVDDGQAFVISRILPPGDHLVDVALTGETRDEGLQFERDINIPDNEWFYVGLADLTVGRRFGSNSDILHQVNPGEYSQTYERGRLAFYLKGKIKGETLITAALDTTEDELDVLLSNLDEKDPRQLLRRLDPDDYYPVYGDDSTTVEDAPTSGRFYVRIERGKSHVLWGNFKTRINGTELARFERGLYGAHAQLRTGKTTTHGEPVAELEAFAAQPGTLPQRDELRGTGGSAYFLRRQDINQGSEQVTIEERDRVTGLVVERTILRPGEDYDIDYVQGVIILRRPLAASSGTSSAVKNAGLGGNDQFLVAVYEYTPTLSDVDGFTYGGRTHLWLNDVVRIGATGFMENTGIADQTLIGADVLIRLSDKSYFEFEWAQSEGDTFGIVTSTDGGFIFTPVSGVNATGRAADAWRAKFALDLGEVTSGQHVGSIGGYYEQRDAGFNAPSRYTSVGERIWGAFGEVEINENVSIEARYDEVNRDDGSNHREIEAEIITHIDDQWTASTGVQHSDVATAIGTTTGTGSRTDLGARITREIDEGSRGWVFGQVTVDRDGTRQRNDRVGIGAEKDLTDKVSVSGEVSYGTSGIGALAALNYQPTVSDKYYLGYRLEPDTTAGDFNGYDPFGDDYGSIVYGANRRVNDQLTTFMEENYDFSGSQRSLTHTYGVTYTPDAFWTLSGGFEAGEIYDSISGDFDRVAVSGTASFKEEGKSGSVRLEARFEEGIGAGVRDRNTYLLTSQLGLMHDDDWRFIAKIDALISESDQSAVLDGDYVEGSIGWAYRPVESDRLNALFKYTYLHDLPGSQQLNVQDQLLGPTQRSHVLSADFIYDLTEQLSIGGKYGFRIGEVSADRSSNNFARSSAHLAIARLDFHVVHNWDVLVEARSLWLQELEQVNFGLLAGVYRHIGDNLKLGAGYNFGRFSDDLTDLTYDDEGVFVNVVGKF